MRVLNTSLVMVMLLCSVSTVNAQIADTDSAKIKDIYIQRMSDYLIFTTDLDDEIEYFEVNTPANDIDLRPNTSLGHGISVSYKYFFFGFGFKYRFIDRNADQNRKGETRSFKYDLDLLIGSLDQNFEYTYTRGFYLNNTDDYDPDWVSGVDPYVTFPNLFFRSFSGSTLYQLNPRFSLSALKAENARQLISAGSLLPHLVYRYYIIDHKNPTNQAPSTQRSDNFEFLISVGYSHTFVLRRNFYFSVGASPYAGIFTNKLTTRLPGGDVITYNTNPIFRLESGAAIGYNSERFFVGAQITTFWTRYRQEGTTAVIHNDKTEFKIFTGYRFMPPGLLAKASDLVETWLPSFLK